MARQRGERYQLHDPVAETIWQVMASADRLVLHSLLSERRKGEEYPECFHGYPSFGTVEAADAESIAAIYHAVRGAAEAGTLGYRCWDPHHGIRVIRGNQVIDFVICFTCECMIMFTDQANDEYQWADISNAPEAMLDDLLTKAGVYLAPRQQR